MSLSDLIPATVLIASEAFDQFEADLSAAAVAAALGAGLARVRAPFKLTTDLCALQAGLPQDFEARLLRARAVVLATPAIDPRTMRETIAFEIATRARQSGVPAYAVLGRCLDPFDARMLDLQSVQLARDVRQLGLAGQRLAVLL